MRQRQQGFSLISLVVVGMFLALSGLIAAQVLPTVLEYQAVLKAVKKASGESSVREVQKSFERAEAIDDIKSITWRELEIFKEDGNVVVEFAYEVEIHLAGPAFLLLKYAGDSR